jgi:hypothetical protein
MVFLLEESTWNAPPLEGCVDAAQNKSHQTAATLTDSSHPDDMKKTTAAGTICPETSTSSSPSISQKGYWQRMAFITRNPYVADMNRFPGAIYKPFRLLLFPAVGFCAVQFSLAILCIAVVVTTQGTLYVLPPYNFSPIGVGNMNLPPVIGSLLGAVICGKACDMLSMRVTRTRNGVFEPETRLWLFGVATCLSVAGLLMYGLTVAKVRRILFFPICRLSRFLQD